MLILETDAALSGALGETLRRAGFSVQLASALPKVLGAGVVVADLERWGQELARAAFSNAPPAVRVALADPPTPASAEAAQALGITLFVSRPGGPEETSLVLDRLCRVLRAGDLLPLVWALSARSLHLAFAARPALLGAVVAFLLEDAEGQFPDRRLPRSDLKLVLYEVLVNAMEHGNLGISAEEKSAALKDRDGLRLLVEKRLQDPKLAARKVRVAVEYEGEAIRVAVRDEGLGFDAAARHAQPLASMTALHGRGLTLVALHTDEVGWNDEGNEIRIRKDLTAHPRPQEAPSRRMGPSTGGR